MILAATPRCSSHFGPTILMSVSGWSPRNFGAIRAGAPPQFRVALIRSGDESRLTVRKEGGQIRAVSIGASNRVATDVGPK